MTEATFQAAVIDLAHLLGWQVAAFRPARTERGWRTPVQADGTGWPDLTLVHPHHGVLHRELKVEGGRLSAEQAQWLSLLKAAGADADTWRPHELPSRILDELNGRHEAAA